ncbi:MAG: 4Fe-4S dicluster domain-containing protein [Chloroflexi bacterium]|nr:4Fe-4S dicluster domain-containing protein [Chloroflexota bacterium]
MPIKSVLSFDAELCTGCRVCEIICSLRHTRQCNSARARLRVSEEEDTGAATLRLCRRCVKAPCVKACPTGAISKDAETEVCVVDKEACIGCRECVDACPFGAMFFDPVAEEVIACDLCGGDPACAKFCAIGALTYRPVGAPVGGEKYYYRKLREARENPVIKASAFASALPVPEDQEK